MPAARASKFNASSQCLMLVGYRLQHAAAGSVDLEDGRSDGTGDESAVLSLCS